MRLTKEEAHISPLPTRGSAYESHSLSWGHSLHLQIIGQTQFHLKNVEVLELLNYAAESMIEGALKRKSQIARLSKKKSSGLRWLE